MKVQAKGQECWREIHCFVQKEWKVQSVSLEKQDYPAGLQKRQDCRDLESGKRPGGHNLSGKNY